MNTFAPAHGLISSLAVISAMITPAILILASGNLVTSTLTRLSRVTDRARRLIAEVREARTGTDEQSIAFHNELLAHYRRRTSLIERALSAYYGAIGLFVTASLAIALDNFLRDTIPWLAVVLVVTGAILLLSGTIALVLETRLGAGVLRREIELSQLARPL